VRQERLGARAERALLAFMIAAERAQVAITVAEGLVGEPVGHTYRRLIDTELRGLLAALDTALAKFAAAALHADHIGDAPPSGAPDDWPDLTQAVATLEARQLALRHAGAFAEVDVSEAANTNAFVHALKSLADVMHVSPRALAHMAGAEASPDLVEPRVLAARFDPYAARWALQVGLGVTIAFVLVVISHVEAFFTALWNPLFIAQSSYGATIRRSGLRILGVFLGAALALLVITTVMPNITGLSSLLLVFLAVIVPCQYVALSGPRLAYVGVQTAFTFIIVVVADQPMTDVDTPLWRALGTLVGTGCLFFVFRLVAPDSAGRQLVARFRDLLRSIISLLPQADAGPMSAAPLLVVRRDVGTAAADIVRLAEEARLEGRNSQVDPRAAVDAVGLATRIAHRSVLIHRGRLLTPWPPLSAATRELLIAVERSVREYLVLLLRVLEARHTTARPGSRPYHAALDAAATVAAVRRPDLTAPLERLTQQLDAVRFSELADWPAAAAGALFAELEHLEGICRMLPKLDDQLIRASLPTLMLADTMSARATPAVAAIAE
jgi:uncharacterized membrane protein YccC